MKDIYRLFPVLIVLMNFAGYVAAYGMILNLGKTPIVYNYLVYIFLSVCCLLFFYKNRNQIIKDYKAFSALYILMLIYVVAAIIKQLFVPSAIFPFQRMQVCTSFISMGCVFFFMRRKTMRRIFHLWWTWVPIVYFFNLFYLSITNTFSILHLVLFFMLVFDFLSRSQKVFVVFGTIMLSLSVLQRMDYIRIAGPLFLFLLNRYHFKFSIRNSKLMFHILMLIPVFFLALGMTGKFNVFDMDSYIKEDYTLTSGERLQDDTRTLLYDEAVTSSLKNGYILWGRTPAYGYDTPWFLIDNGKHHKWYNVGKLYPQRNSEVFVVNIFTWTGLVGIIAWFIFYYYIGLKVIKKSHNKYLRILVLYVGIFWIGSWIEYPFDYPNVGFTTLYLVLSICMQKHYQVLNNYEMERVMNRLFR